MGNEMGNSNTSGLQDEDNTKVEVPEKSLQGYVHTNEGKDFHEKVAGSASDSPGRVGDPHVDSKTPDRNEKDETEVQVQPLAESPKAAILSDEASGEDSVVGPASLSVEADDHQKLINSNLEDHLSVEKKAPVKKEEEGTRNSTFDTISASHDPEPAEPTDLESEKHELGEINPDPSVENESTGSPRGCEPIPVSTSSCHNENNGHMLDTEVSNNLSGSDVCDADPKVEKTRDDLFEKEIASQEGEMSCKEKLEVKDRDCVEEGLKKIASVPSDLLGGIGDKCDGEVPAESNSSKIDFSEPDAQVILMAMSPGSHLEDSETQDKCMILTEETKMISQESEKEENQHDHESTQSHEEMGKESKTDFVMESDLDEDNEKNIIVPATCDVGSNKVSQIDQEAKITENGVPVDAWENNHSEASREEAMVVPELGTVPAESSAVTGCTCEEEEATEKQIVEETDMEAAKQCIPQPSEVEQAEGFQLLSPISLILSQSHHQDTDMASEIVLDRNISTSELKQESFGEFFATNASIFNSTDLRTATSVSVVELAQKHEQSHSQCNATTPVVAAETDAANKSSESESSAFATGGTETRESTGRFSIESNPDDLDNHVQMRKSPSFNLDLRIEARVQESDQTPLLYQDKSTATEILGQAAVNLGNPIAHTGYGQDLLQYQAIAVEEKVVTLERSNSEKSQTPFLGFLKENEETNIAITPQKQQQNHDAAKKVTSTSPKIKEKRKPRSSLFGNCMCCATVIN